MERTVIHGGEQTIVKVALIEKELPPLWPGAGPHHRLWSPGAFDRDAIPGWIDKHKNLGNWLRDLLRKELVQGRGTAEQQIERVRALLEQAEGRAGAAVLRTGHYLADALVEARSLGWPRFAITPGDGGERVLHWRDDDHTIEIRKDADGQATLEASARDGERLYRGLLLAPDQLDVLPPALRDKVATLIDLSDEASEWMGVEDDQLELRQQ